MTAPGFPSLCVFCGSAVGTRPAYADAARALAAELVRRRLDLVYGGGSVGLMGVVADAVLAAGGRAIGVIPRPLATKELLHAGLTETHLVASMHERKALMAELAGGFVALPGGLGTLEELLEILTWSQLGIHQKPIGVLNVGGYWDGFAALLDRAVDEGFVSPENRALLLVADGPAALLDRLAAWEPPVGERLWLRLVES
jgi:uncharacterized protein (TIGR00730 family)